MPLLPIILVAEIIFASLTLNFPKRQNNNVLGVQLADESGGDSSTSDSQSQPPVDTSQNTNPPPPAEQSPQNNPPSAEPTVPPLNPAQSSSQPETLQPNQSTNTTQEPANSGLTPQNVPNPTGEITNGNTSPYEQSTNPDNPAYFNDILSPSDTPAIYETSNSSTPTPEAQTNPTSGQEPSQIPSEAANQSATNTSSSEFTPAVTPTPVETYPNQTGAVLDANDLLNTSENISQQSVDEAKKEEDQINQTADPTDQTKLLINFAADKVKDVNNSIKNDDFASTNFASQRFNEQIDKAVDNLQNLPPPERTKLQKQLVNFCSQTDYVLKTAELSVPEEAEQDLEINRAKCLNIQQ